MKKIRPGVVDFSGITTHRWLWPAIEVGAVVFDLAARFVRRQETIRDAREGRHGNHTVCRHGRAVTRRR